MACPETAVTFLPYDSFHPFIPCAMQTFVSPTNHPPNKNKTKKKRPFPQSVHRNESKEASFVVNDSSNRFAWKRL
jgi:hypothetical protein